MVRLVVGGLAALGLAVVLVLALNRPAAAECFVRSRPVLPDAQAVAATLNTGDAGRAALRAVAAGDAAAVTALLAADPGLLATRTVLPEGVRPFNGNMADLLTAAVARCDGAMIAALLAAGADPGGAIPGLALGYAVLADTPDMARLLLHGGAQPDAHDPALNPPLHEALVYERADAVALLAAHGADVNRADAVGRIPLGTALSGQNWPVVQALIDAGANPWQVHNQGVLPAYMIFISEPADPADRAIRDALVDRIAAAAPIWPPVDATEVMARFRDGSWPTPAQRDAGLFASPEAMAIMRRAGP